jgi:hypothetical protein
MGYACVLTSASKAGTTGGTFADALVANTGDTLAVANYGGDPSISHARVLEAWAIDSTSVAEVSWVYTRPQSTHDQSRGFRFEIPALVPGGANSVAGHNVLGGYGSIDLFKSDTPVINATTTAADNILMSWVTEYDDLPGVQGVFANWTQVQQLQVSTVGINSQAQASATRGAYGATRAFNADDDRLHANTWYALLGWTVRTQVTTISLLGPDWGGQRIGGPAGVLNLDNSFWFVDQDIKWSFGHASGNPKGKIPCFNSNNKAAINVQVADGAASTTPQIDFILYELSAQPGP